VTGGLFGDAVLVDTLEGMHTRFTRAQRWN
jgi:hypothetical protein